MPNTNNSTTQLPNYLPIIGMEVHAELKTQSKMFCGCKNDPFHAEKPNIHTCPVCLGMPGGLPVANKTAIEWVIKLGLALNCKINLFSKFDRKNYFYPDLPKGYQISQYDIPFCYDGVLETEEGPVRIHRIHLEEDTGKLQHKTISTSHSEPGQRPSVSESDQDKSLMSTQKVSLIDFNRGGVPLVEIVTEPDIHSANHAKAYAKKLRQTLRFLEISDCDMEQGSMRLEANISITKDNPQLPTFKLPNYKVEVKNINSFNFLAKAIEFEIKRHAEMLDIGETPTQETRGWNEDKGITFSQRTKEDAEDYRYFPDPDLPPVVFTEAQIEQFRSELPELPDQIIVRWEKDYGVEAKYSQEFLEEVETFKQAEELFSQALAEKLDVNKLANLLVNKKLKATIGDEISKIISEFKTSTTVETVDEGELTKIIESVLNENPKAVQDYKAGKEQLSGFFIGQVMRKLGKKVDPQLVRQSVVNALQQR